MRNITVFGDLHIREGSPYSDAFNSFHSWVQNQEWNDRDNIGLFLGDIFHRNCPLPVENDMAISFFTMLKFDKIYILAGNHDLKRRISALDIFNSFSKIIVKYKPEAVDILGVRSLFLPHFDTGVYDDWKDMKTCYEDKSNLLLQGDYDYVFGHYSENNLFGAEIDTSWIKGKKVLGHVHRPSSGKSYLGTPYITRMDERGQEGRLMQISAYPKDATFIPVPKMLDYYDIEYGAPVTSLKIDAKHYFLDINNAPNLETAKSLYTGENIHRILVLNKTTNNITDKENGSKTKTLSEYMTDFVKANSGMADSLRVKLLELIT
jgi:hypothetical protein